MRSRKRRMAEEVERATRRVRDDYDGALGESGVILFRQVTPGSDGHYVSPSLVQVLGWDATAFREPGTLRGLVHPDDLDTFRSLVPVGPPAPPAPPPGTAEAFTAEPAARQAAVTVEPVVRFLAADGGWRHLLVRRTPAAPDEPVRGVLVDVTVSETGRIEERRFADVIRRSADAVVLLEFVDLAEPTTLLLRSANPTARRLFNLEHHSVDGTRIDEIFGPASCRLLRSALFDVAHTGESLTAERLSFAELPGTWLDLRLDRLPDGTLAATVADVTRTVNLEDRLRHQASHDALTGLPNRTLLDERLSTLTTGLSEGHHLALVLVGLGALHDVNSTMGHQYGDQLLVEVGRRLTAECPEADLVARIGGDEFAVLGSPCPGQAAALELGRSVEQALARPLDVDGHMVHATARVGVAVAPAHGGDPRTLLHSADAALQHAHADAVTLQVHDPVAERTSVRRVGLLTELRRGLANQDLELRFQPLVELRTGRVARVEALLRWQREDGGSRIPVELLELAEQSGLVEPLTRWVLGESARTATRLARPGDTVVVSANLSLRQLADPALLSFVELLLTSGELSPELVEVEISETELGDDPVRAQQVISRLSGMGLRVVVDNFGTGYTSMATMAALDVKGIKIDRSYITTLASAPADLGVVRSTVELAHGLGLTVAAEGVADGDTLALLAEMGCDHAQGVHLSGPVTLDALPARVTELEEAMQGWVAVPGPILLD
ncbi:MAG: putative bifunctional diguanylate cyclase/phosphodiesterase [Microthrixaceae bacterium]